MILKLSLCERQNMLREGIPTKIYTYESILSKIDSISQESKEISCRD